MKLINSMPSTQILALKKIFIILGILIIQSNLSAEEVKEVGKFKDWTTLISNSDDKKFVLHNLNQYYNLQKAVKEKQDFL